MMTVEHTSVVAFLVGI